MQFSIRTIFLLMLGSSVVAAGGTYLVQALRSGSRAHQLVFLLFLLFLLVGPVFVMLVLSLSHRLARLRRRSPWLRAGDPPES